MKIEQFWDDSIVPPSPTCIRIPAKSPHFDKAWQKNGYIDAAVALAADLVPQNPVPGMKLEVVRLEGHAGFGLWISSFQLVVERNRPDVRAPG